jgi:hypothetical protein
MVVLVDRIDQRLVRRRTRRHVVVQPFAISPSIVPPAAAGRLVVDLFVTVLTHVANDQGASAAARGIVEVVPPGVPQTERPDLGTSRDRRALDERVAGRHPIAGRIRVGNAHVDTKHLAEQLRRVLRAVIGIVARSAVTESHVEKPVGSEREMTAVVVRKRLRDERGARRSAPTQIETRCGVRDHISAGPSEARDDGIAGAL